MSAYQTAQQVANQGHGTSPLFWIIYIAIMSIIIFVIYQLIKHWFKPLFKALKNWINHWSSME